METKSIKTSQERRRIAVSQSNYLPWLGYFALINSVSTFVIYDSAQFTKNDWRNRNRIMSNGTAFWISVPCLTKGRMGQAVFETEVKPVDWVRKHISSMRMSYGKTPHFAWFEERLFPTLLELETESQLSEVNQRLLNLIIGDLGIPTEILSDHMMALSGDANSKLIQICRQLNATEYVSGPSGSNYLDLSLFRERGITVQYMNYSPVSNFLERWAPVAQEPLSVIDTIARLGVEAVGEFLERQRNGA